MLLLSFLDTSSFIILPILDSSMTETATVLIMTKLKTTTLTKIRQCFDTNLDKSNLTMTAMGVHDVHKNVHEHVYEQVGVHKHVLEHVHGKNISTETERWKWSRRQRLWRSVEGQAVGVDAVGGGGGQGNNVAAKEVEAPAPLEEVVALALIDEAEAPLVE